jgi:predicted pyridoxine 5'-phosphate oxidase superfamily flavin-nucleotide-binding protein
VKVSRIRNRHERVISAPPERPEATLDRPATAWRAAVTLTEDMRRVVLEQKLGFAATVCPDGTPNLSPKGTTTVWDDSHLVFADIRSPNTVRNLRENPSIEINVVDPIVRKGYRFKGRAELHTGGEVYEQGLRLLAGRGFDARRERIKTIVLIRIERVMPLVSPAYDEGASEDDVAAKWEAHAETLASRRHRAR